MLEYGRCDCESSDCKVARAVRRAAAEKLVEAMRAGYGEPMVTDDCPLWIFAEREWVCRAFPWRNAQSCPSCGYVPKRLPAAFKHGAVFGLRGACYRVVSVGSTNRYSPNGLHSEDYLRCELVKEVPWALPTLPATKGDVSAALDVLFNDLPMFRWMELEGALLAV
jgi:hypothetical protein